MEDWNLGEIHANYQNKGCYILHTNIYVMEFLHECSNLDEKSVTKWQYLQPLWKNKICNEWQIIIGSYQVLVDTTWVVYN